MTMPNFMGLSNLGLTQPSASSKVDNASQPSLLQQLMSGSNDILDNTAKSKLLEQQLAAQQAQPQQGLLQQLLSPQGLLSLIGTGVAGAQGGAGAAGQFGLGALGEMATAAEAKNSAQRLAIDETQKRLDETQKRLDASRNRVATLFNTNPEAFVNPVTGEQTVAPDVLGFYTSGVPIPLFASTRRAMDRRDDSWKAQTDLLMKGLEGSQSPDQAESTLKVVFQHLNAPLPPDVAHNLAASFGTKNMQPELISTMYRYFGSSFLDAQIAMAEQGKTLSDPSILSMLQYQDPEPVGKVTPADQFLSLAQEINDWQSNTNNRERLIELRKENPGQDEFSRALAQEVLGGREGDLRTYLHEAGLHEPSDFAQNMANFADLKKKYGLGVQLSGMKEADPISKMSPDEQNQFFWGQSLALTEQQKKLAQDNQNKQDLKITNDSAVRLRKELKLAPADANEIAGAIVKKAQQNAMRPDGSIDRVRFEQEVRKITDDSIKETKR